MEDYYLQTISMEVELEDLRYKLDKALLSKMEWKIFAERCLQEKELLERYTNTNKPKSNDDRMNDIEKVKQRFAEYGKVITEEQVNTILDMAECYLGLDETIDFVLSLGK